MKPGQRRKSHNLVCIIFYSAVEDQVYQLWYQFLVWRKHSGSENLLVENHLDKTVGSITVARSDIMNKLYVVGTEGTGCLWKECDR